MGLHSYEGIDQVLANLEPDLNIYILDNEYRYLYFNEIHRQAMKSTFQSDIQVGQIKIDYLPESEKTSYTKHYRRALKGETFKYVERFDQGYIQFQFFPFDNKNGERELLVKAKDVTEQIKVSQELERYRAELENLVEKRTKELREQRNFIQSVMDEIPNLIYVRNNAGNYVFVNQAYSNTLGLPIEEITNRNMFDVHPDEEDVHRFRQEDLDVLANGKSLQLIDNYIDDEGGTKWLSVTKKKIKLGNDDFVLGVMSDISDLIKTRNDLEESNRNLSQTLKDLKEMQLRLVASEKIASILLLTSGFMHEINNPINYVSGNVEPLRRDIEDLHGWLQSSDFLSKNPEEKENYELTKNEIDILLDGISEGTDRVKDLVKNLRNLASSGETERTTCHVHEIIDSILTMLNLVLEQRQISIHQSFGDSIPFLYSNPHYLHQIFINIFDYMITRMNEGDALLLKTSSIQNWIMIEIIDESRGITEKEIHRMIDPFDKINPDSKMGLAVSYRIASKIHGTIEVSEAAQKTHFLIRIPSENS